MTGQRRGRLVTFLHRLLTVLSTSGTCLWFKKWSDL